VVETPKERGIKITHKGRKQRGKEKKEGEVIKVGTVIIVCIEEVVKLYAEGKKNPRKSWSPLIGQKKWGRRKERGKEIKVQSFFITLCFTT